MSGLFVKGIKNDDDAVCPGLLGAKVAQSANPANLFKHL